MQRGMERQGRDGGEGSYLSAPVFSMGWKSLSIQVDTCLVMGEGQHTQRETMATWWLCPLEALSSPIRGLTTNTCASSRQPWGRASNVPETGLQREKLLRSWAAAQRWTAV